MLTHGPSVCQVRCARSSCRRWVCQRQEHRGERCRRSRATSMSFWLLLFATSAVHAFDGSPPNRHPVERLTLSGHKARLWPSLPMLWWHPHRATLRRKGIDPMHSPCSTGAIVSKSRPRWINRRHLSSASVVGTAPPAIPTSRRQKAPDREASSSPHTNRFVTRSRRRNNESPSRQLALISRGYQLVSDKSWTRPPMWQNVEATENDHQTRAGS